MTLTADNFPVGFRARQVGIVDTSEANPTIILEWDEDNVGPYIQDEDGSTTTLVTSTIMTGYATGDPNTASEVFYFTAGELVDGETRQIQYTATVRALPNGQTTNPPTTEFTANKILHSDEAFYVVNEAPWVKSLITAFNASVAEVANKYAQFQLFSGSQDVTVGDGRAYFVVPSGYNAHNLSAIQADVITAGTTGTTDIQIHNVTQATDMLSTKCTIDSGEISSLTATTPAVIDTDNDDVATGDVLRIDIDATSTTEAQGLIISLIFNDPS